MTIDTNELRRLAQAATPGPWFSDARGNIWRRPLSDLYENGGSVAGDKPIAFVAAGWRGEGVTGYPVENNARLIAASNPSAVIELLDRLEAAESVLEDFGTTAQEVECWLERYRCIEREAEALRTRLEAAEADALEQARLNGMGGEREAALMAKLETAEKERDALRAKIAAMERQEPYAFAVVFPETSRVELVHDLDDLYEDMTTEAHEVRKLYLTSFQSQKENEND